MVTTEVKRRVEARRAELTARHNDRRAARRAAAAAMRSVRPIATEWLGYCLGELQKEVPECIFVDESLTSHAAVWNHVDCDQPESMYGSGGSSLGWGLGAALGVKLARPDRPVVLVVGDGSFVFGEPVAALWASQMNQAPLLVVIFNNGCYNANKAPLINAYPDGYSVSGRRFVGTDLAPSPRYDLLAAVVGAAGERVDDPEQLLPALRRGLDHVRAGQSIVLDVILGQA
jgi:acetolactate synthase-1/2/3 large subunit